MELMNLMEALGSDGRIENLIDKMTDGQCPGEREFIDEFVGKIPDEELSRKVSGMVDSLCANSMNTAFEVGYAIGQMFDVRDPEALKELEGLKKRIIKGKVLPYVPREKKAA